MSTARDPKAMVSSASAVLAGRAVPGGSPHWCLAELAGRLVEIAGWRSGAGFSSAISLVVDAQRSGETAIWVGPRSRSFFPPDAESAGVDLAAFPVARVRESSEIPVAADLLARSGAFGLVVLDLGSSTLSLGVLSRLAGLARAHESAIVLLSETAPDRPSLDTVVSFRADTSFKRQADITISH